MKQTWELILLLVLSFGCVFVYAFVPDKIAERLLLKQINLESLLDNGKETNPHESKVDSIKEEPVDTTSQRVLMFGDSMTSSLAMRMSDYTNKNGHSLTCVTWISSNTHSWAESDTLQYYIQKVKPTHIFVCLGSNELYTTDMKGSERRIRSILSKIGNIPFVWIGPPNWCKDNGYNKLLEKVMGSRYYYPSYKLSFERQKDGRHPTIASSYAWMDKIVEWINAGHSVHPFRLDKPDKRNRHYKQITIMPRGTKCKADSIAKKDSTVTVPESNAQSMTAGQEHCLDSI